MTAGDTEKQAVMNSSSSLVRDKSFEAVRLLLEGLHEKHHITYDELLTELALDEENHEPEVPVTVIADRSLGALQSIVKYLKENQRKTFAEISTVLNRDSRTVWVTYSSAKKKRKEKIDPEPTDCYIPLSVLSNRALGPVESVVQYLRDHESLGFTDIARLLNRDPRSIWASYQQAKKKSPPQGKKAKD